MDKNKAKDKEKEAEAFRKSIGWTHEKARLAVANTMGLCSRKDLSDTEIVTIAWWMAENPNLPIDQAITDFRTRYTPNGKPIP